MIVSDDLFHTTNEQEDINTSKKKWYHWKDEYSKANTKRALRSKEAGEGDQFGSANLSHQYYSAHLPDSSPTEVALLSQLENALENISSAAINEKAVLENLVACNSKLTDRNAVLTATSKQFFGEFKVM